MKRAAADAASGESGHTSTSDGPQAASWDGTPARFRAKSSSPNSRGCSAWRAAWCAIPRPRKTWRRRRCWSRWSVRRGKRSPGASLRAWLGSVTRMLARQFARSDRRRRVRELVSAEGGALRRSSPAGASKPARIASSSTSSPPRCPAAGWRPLPPGGPPPWSRSPGLARSRPCPWQADAVGAFTSRALAGEARIVEPDDAADRSDPTTWSVLATFELEPGRGVSGLVLR